MTSITVEESLRQGNLEQALALAQDRVRAEPATTKHRVLLFQLMAVMGRWDRALNQLEVMRELDAATLVMAQVYGDAARCEVLRSEIFAGRRSPLVFGEPESWMARFLEASRLAGAGLWTEAAPLRDRALEDAPDVSGTINGEPFAWIVDADTRLGPVLEVVILGKYTWVPFQRIREIHVGAPSDLRDLVWIQAHFVWTNGGDAPGLIPVRYPGSESASDSRLAMARFTDWSEPAQGAHVGLGQRMLMTDRADYSILDVRDIQLVPEGSAASLPQGGEGS